MDSVTNPTLFAALNYLPRHPTKDETFEKLVSPQKSSHAVPLKGGCREFGGHPSFIPFDWKKFVFRRQRVVPPNVELFHFWPVAYVAVQLDERKKVIPPGPVVSPSIDYAAHQTTPWKNGDVWEYCVFEVRVRPNSFTIQGNSLPRGVWGDANVLFDPNFGPHQLEWVVQNPQTDLEVVAVLTCSQSQDPKQALKTRFLNNQQLRRTALPAGPGKGVWLYNSAPGTSSTTTHNGPFRDYSESLNASIEEAYLQGRSLFFFGLEFHGQPQYYFIEFRNNNPFCWQFNCANHQRYRLVKRILVNANEDWLDQ